MIVDLHSHYFPADALTSVYGLDPDVIEGTSGDLTVEMKGHSLWLPASLTNLDDQRAALERQRLDRRALMPPPYALLYELASDDGLAWSVALNDGISQAVSDDPERFIGFGTVPLQDPAVAVTELRRAVLQLGLTGVEILTNVDGIGLDDRSLEPFWSAVEDLDIPILIHPHNIAGVERMGAFYLRNLIGNPTETAHAGARILFSGVFERHAGLKLILSHGGGALPHLIGRLRHGFEVRPECRERTVDPIGHLGSFYYDTVVFDPLILRHLVELVGVDRIVVGTDFPFDMGETDPVGFIRRSGLKESDVQTILRSGERLIS